MKILVIGGMHGNEPLGLEVVKLFQDKPVRNVDSVLANSQAITANSRFIREDLNRSFPGDSKSKVFEQKRAAELLELAKKYDIVLDFHNTHCPDNNCGFIGEAADDLLYSVANGLELKRVIIADYDCINKYAVNCLSVEISLNSPQNNAKVWYQLIEKLAPQDNLKKVDNLEKYRFVYRVTNQDKDKFMLSRQNWRAFEPIDNYMANELGVKTPAYPIFIGDDYTPYYYAGLLNRID